VATEQLHPAVKAVEPQVPVGMLSRNQHLPAESIFIGFFQISPLPKQHHDTRKRENGCSNKTAILTSSPYKQKLVEKMEEKKKGTSTKQICKNVMGTTGKKLRDTAETGVSKGKKRKNGDRKDALPRERKKKKISNREKESSVSKRYR